MPHLCCFQKPNFEAPNSDIHTVVITGPVVREESMPLYFRGKEMPDLAQLDAAHSSIYTPS